MPAGFFLASNGQIDWWLLVSVFFGSTFIIGSACVLNNYLDQDIDRHMSRTKNRPLITGEVSSQSALLLCIILGVAGFSWLYVATHPWVWLVGAIGFIDYVWFYGAWSKRKSIYGTLVGSISGAIPILAGYLAVKQGFDLGALLVFAILFLWQMPEFYSIAIYRLNEYKAANVPVISVVNGIDTTRKHILGYTLAFVVASLLLYVFNYTGITYAIFMAASGGYWIWLGFKGQSTSYPDKWANQMFKFSLVILLLFCLLISVDAYLP